MQLIEHNAARVASLSCLALLALAAPAQAHICMEAPVSRVGPNCTSAAAQKPGPCGINTRSTKYVTEFKPGETITVTLNETVNHDSHYRIAFNPNGAMFEDPTSKDDKDGKHPYVLLDGIVDESAARQSIKVTLPNMTCDNCTLQLIQVMYDKTANGFGNDDIYYSCADIVIKGAATPSVDAGSGAPARPAADAGAMQDPGTPPDAPQDAGDSGSASADAGGGTPSTGGEATDASADEDEGGCTLAYSRRARPVLACAALLLFAALISRRRRRG